MSDLVSVTEYKTYRSITESTYDSLLQILIDGVEDEAAQWCGRTWAYGTYTEYFNQGNRFSLTAYPVASITSLVSVDVDGTSTTIDADLYTFAPATGIVSMKERVVAKFLELSPAISSWGPTIVQQNVFLEGFRNIAVTYVGGYDDAASPTGPAPRASLKKAVYDEVDLAFLPILLNSGGDPTMDSERLGSYSYKRSTAAELDEMYSRRWGPFRRIVL